MPNAMVHKAYDTVSAERRMELTGLEFVQGLADGTLPLNTIARTLGYDVIEAANGRVVVAVEPNGEHLNPAGTVHGGLAATLLDTCMGLAVQSTLEKGRSQTTLEFKISLVRPVTPGMGLIKAEGRVLSCGRRVGTAEGRLTDDKGRLLAHGTTTCLIFQDRPRIHRRWPPNGQFAAFSLAQVSRKPMVRLNTSRSGAESLSRTK
jgi:uncharacterized protein (TIGR00369 family)